MRWQDFVADPVGAIPDPSTCAAADTARRSGRESRNAVRLCFRHRLSSGQRRESRGVRRPAAGTETTSDARGYFSIEDQFSGLVTARATKDGYAPSVVTSRATTDRRFYVLFQLASITAPVSVAGNYTLTISADSACTALPDDARTRSYLARVTAGSEFGRDSFSGTVTGGQFAGNRFWIGVFGDYVTISTAGEGPSLVEQVGPNRYLAFYGDDSVSVGARDISTISAPFKGSIEYCELKSALGQYYDCSPALAAVREECTSNNNQLTLARR
jgi:hypothetical protein